MPRSRSTCFAVLAAALLLTSLAPGRASAQQVQASYKGTIGLGLIGAELGFVIPTVSGLHRTWSLVTFPILGATGGAIGGYFIDTRVNSRALSVSTLVVGLAFAVPSVILTVGATRYDTDDLQDDTATSARRVRLRNRMLAQERRNLVGDGMLRRSGGEWSLAMPGLHVSPLQRVAADGRVEVAGGEIRMTLLSGAF